MANKYNAKKNKEKENIDLSLTMQQKFNFDSNKLDEEVTKVYKSKRKQSNTVNTREKELRRLKDMYKKKYKTSCIIAILLLIGCITVSSLYIFVKPKEVTKEVIKVKIKKEMPERVVFLGDSITWMYDLKKFYPDSKYYMINSGVSWATSEQILANLGNKVFQFEPKKVFILIGTNDIEKQKSKEQIVANIREMVEEIQEKAENCEVYIESLYPINNTDDDRIDSATVGKLRKNDLIKKINKDIETLAKELEVTYINIYDLLVDDEGNLKLEYTKEGLHLVDEGYEVVTKKIKKYL